MASVTTDIAAKPASAAVPKGAWKITFLLFLYMLVNFADKIIVGLAGVPIMTDMKLSPKDFGFLGSAFFFLFSISAIIVGFIVNRVQTRWVLLVLGLIWALTQFPMIWDVSYTTLLVCRIILGAGEGPAFAVAAHALYKWFPDEKRTLPTAILSQGSAFGVIIAVPALNWIIVNYSWHAAFGALGGVGLLWVLAWLALGREGPIVDELRAEGGVAGPAHIPYSQLLSTPTFIGCCIATFGAYWSLVLGLTWFTPYIRALGYNQERAGYISILPWVLGATMVLLTGWLSQVMMARGANSRLSRGVLGSVPLIVGGVLLYASTYLPSGPAQIGLLCLATGMCGAIYVVCPPMISEFSPTSQRGAMIAIYGALYTTAGILAPYVMGTVIEGGTTPLDGYMRGFQIQALILVVSGALGFLLLWPNRERARLAAGAVARVGV
jgi:MFS family permease